MTITPEIFPCAPLPVIIPFPEVTLHYSFASLRTLHKRNHTVFSLWASFTQHYDFKVTYVVVYRSSYFIFLYGILIYDLYHNSMILWRFSFMYFGANMYTFMLVILYILKCNFWVYDICLLTLNESFRQFPKLYTFTSSVWEFQFFHILVNILHFLTLLFLAILLDV